MQQLLIKACKDVINTANNCVEDANSNKVFEYTNTVDAINIIVKVNIMFTNEREKRLKPALTESKQSLCDQDLSQLVYLLGEIYQKNSLLGGCNF